MAGLDPAIPLKKAQPCPPIGTARASPAMTGMGPSHPNMLQGMAEGLPAGSCVTKGGSGMSELTPDEVRAAVHPIDDAIVAEIIATGATPDELVEPCHIFARERKQWGTGDVPPGRVGQVVSI